jgi:hypothetical protein
MRTGTRPGASRAAVQTSTEKDGLRRNPINHNLDQYEARAATRDSGKGTGNRSGISP